MSFNIEIDRLGRNGQRYVATENRQALELFCLLKGIPARWICDPKVKYERYYLHLRGRYIHV